MTAAPIADATPTATTALRGSFVTLGGQWTKLVVQTASLSVLAHLLSAGSFGLVAMVTAIVGVATVVGDFGLSLAAIQAKTLSAPQRSNLFWLNAAVGLVLSGLVLLLAHPIAVFYDKPDLATIVRALSITFLLNGLTTQFKAELTRSFAFGKLSLVDVVSQALAFGVAVAVAESGGGYWALVAQQITVTGAALLLAAVLCGWLPGRPTRGADMGNLVGFGANAMGVQTMTYASANVDNVLVGRFWGAASLGVYSRAYNLFELPVQQLAAPLTRVVMPILARVADQKERYVAYLERAQLMLSYGLIGAFAVAASVAQPLVGIVLGPHWHAAAPIFQLLALGGVFQALGYMYYWIFLSLGKTALQLRFSLVGRAIMIGLIFVGVQFSPRATAAGVAAGFFLIWLIYSLYGVPRAGIAVGRINANAVRCIVFLLAMVGVSQLAYHGWLQTSGVWAALGGGLVVDGLVVGLAFLAVPPVRRDLQLVWATLALVARRKVPTPSG
jgi:PST family polysaccharide transporter